MLMFTYYMCVYLDTDMLCRYVMYIIHFFLVLMTNMLYLFIT